MGRKANAIEAARRIIARAEKARNINGVMSPEQAAEVRAAKRLIAYERYGAADVTQKRIEQAMRDAVSSYYGTGEAQSPSYDLGVLARYVEKSLKGAL